MEKKVKRAGSTKKETIPVSYSRLPIDLDNSVPDGSKLDKPGTGDLVGRILSARYLCGDATLHNVARDLGIQPKTLNRRLLREHTTFRHLRSYARFQLASQFLSH